MRLALALAGLLLSLARGAPSCVPLHMSMHCCTHAHRGCEALHAFTTGRTHALLQCTRSVFSCHELPLPLDNQRVLLSLSLPLHPSPSPSPSHDAGAFCIASLSDACITCIASGFQWCLDSSGGLCLSFSCGGRVAATN